MQIKKIGKEILKICESDKFPYKENKYKLYELSDNLRDTKIINEEQLQEFISIHRKLTKIRNRKASYIEEEIARLILVSLPFKIKMRDEEIPDDVLEELQESYEPNTRMGLKMSSQLLRYSKEIISSKEDKSKRYKKRIKEAIRMLNELQQFYEIKGIKAVFTNKISDKDKDLQFFALYGLEVYYAHENAEKLTKEEEKKLEEIIKKTDTRETASTCCQILINAGKIDEFGALYRIDEWKERNWN